MTTFTKANQDRMNTWMKNIPNIKNLDDIIKNHDLVYKWIIKQYKNINSRKSHLSTLAVVFRDTKSNDELYHKYSELATKYNEQSVTEAKKGGMRQGREFVQWSDILSVRDKLKKDYENDKTNKKTNLSYLLLCLYTMQPPLRMEYKDMKIIKAKTEDNNSDNFLLIRNGESTTIINHDKVSRKYGKSEFKLNDELHQIIIDSLKEFKRTYLLSRIRDGTKPLNAKGFNQLLSEAFAPRKMSVDIIRSSYVTHVYNEKPITVEEKEKIANKMRTSVGNSEIQYNKFGMHKKVITCPKCAHQITIV